MPVSADFKEYVLEQLSGLGSLRTRGMFGGVGLYHDELFFAIIDDDTLYFKVNESTRGEYLARGMHPFCPFPGQPVMGGYFTVPVEILEEGSDLVAWARRACDVALKAQAGTISNAADKGVSRRRAKARTSGKTRKSIKPRKPATKSTRRRS